MSPQSATPGAISEVTAGSLAMRTESPFSLPSTETLGSTGSVETFTV